MKELFQETFIWKNNPYQCRYLDTTSFDTFHPVNQVQALCMLDSDPNTFVIYEDNKGAYGLPGGTVESGETLLETLSRELMEEVSVQVIDCKPLLLVEVYDVNLDKTYYQARYWAQVKLKSDVINDPDGVSQKRHLVNENQLLLKLNWGRKLDEYLKKYKSLIQSIV